MTDYVDPFIQMTHEDIKVPTPPTVEEQLRDQLGAETAKALDLQNLVTQLELQNAELVKERDAARDHLSEAAREVQRKITQLQETVEERNANARSIEELKEKARLRDEQLTRQAEYLTELQQDLLEAKRSRDAAMDKANDLKLRLRVTERAVIALALTMSSNLAIMEKDGTD